MKPTETPARSGDQQLRLSWERDMPKIRDAWRRLHEESGKQATTILVSGGRPCAGTDWPLLAGGSLGEVTGLTIAFDQRIPSGVMRIASDAGFVDIQLR